MGGEYTFLGTTSNKDRSCMFYCHTCICATVLRNFLVWVTFWCMAREYMCRDISSLYSYSPRNFVSRQRFRSSTSTVDMFSRYPATVCLEISNNAVSTPFQLPDIFYSLQQLSLQAKERPSPSTTKPDSMHAELNTSTSKRTTRLISYGIHSFNIQDGM